jgi:hypothetical protein
MMGLEPTTFWPTLGSPIAVAEPSSVRDRRLRDRGDMAASPEEIDRFLQAELVRRDLGQVTAVEAATWLRLLRHACKTALSAVSSGNR